MAGRSPASPRILRVLPWAGGIALVLFVLLVLPFLLVRDAAVRAWLLNMSLHRDLFAPEWSMTIDSVNRFNPAYLEMKGIHIVHHEPGGDHAWASLGTIKVGWNPRHLLRRRLWAERIVLDSLVVHTEVPAPRFRVVSKGEQKVRVTPKLPWLRLGSFELSRVTISGDGGPIATGSIAMGRLEHHDRSIHGEFDETRLLYVPDSISVRLSGGTIDGVLLDRFTLEGMEISAPGLSSRLGGEAVIPAPGGLPRIVALWEVASMRPLEIPPMSRLRFPFARGDSLRGTVRVEYRPPILSAQLDLDGEILGGQLERLDLEASRSGDTLKVGHLIVRHRAGNVDGWGGIRFRDRGIEGRLGFDGVDLGDASLARWLPRAPSTRIDGAVQGTASLVKGNESAKLSGEINRLDVRGTPLGPVRFSGDLADALLTLDSLVVGPRGAGLWGAGSWATGTGQLGGSATLDNLPLERYVAPFLPVSIAGAFDGQVEVRGNVHAPNLTGWLDGYGFRILDVNADHIRGDSLAGLLAPIGISGRVRMQGIDLYGAKVDSADFRVAWEKTLRVQARASVDSLVAEAMVDVTPVDPGFLLIESFQVRPGSQPAWDGDGECRVFWNKGTARIENLALASSDGEIRARLDVGKGGNPLAAEIRISEFDLRLARELLGLPDSALAGHLDLEASFGGSTKAPSGLVRIVGREMVAARWPIGDLEVDASLDGGGTIRVDSLIAGGGEGRGRVRATGLEIVAPVPLPEFLSSLHNPAALLLRRTALAGHVRIDDLSVGRIVKTGLESVPGGGKNLFIESADPMTGRIRTVRPGQNGGVTSLASVVGGAVSLDLNISGSAASPRVKAIGSIRALRLYQARADSLLFSATYAPQTLTLDSLVWHQGNQVDHATGEMPLILSLGKGISRVPLDRPLRLDAELPDIDLAVLGLVSRDILDPAGTLSGSISLRGTPKRIWPEGSLAIRDGGLRIPKREEKLHSIQGVFTLDSSGVQIRSLQGRLGKDGRLNVTGWWRDLSHFNLEAKVQQATFFETGFYHVTADGDLNAFPVASAVGSYPLIVGTVDVREGAIIGDLAKQPLPPAGALLRRSPWRAEIDVNAPGNLRMSTAIASVDLGEGQDIHVSFQDPVINVSGRIQVLGGRYRVFNNVFTITSGTVEFRDTGRLPEPILDVNAETRVNDRTIPGEAAQEVLVKIHATGPVLALNIEFSSEPSRSQSEIVELLSLGRLNDPTVGSFGAKDPSRQYLFTEVVSQIESQLANRIAGLESFQLLPGNTPGEAWKVSVRRTLLPQVSVAYSRELTGTANQEVNVRYNLRGQFYLNADVERLMNQGTPTDRYSLDLRMRFEY